DHFVQSRRRQIADAAAMMHNQQPIIVSPYDAELFGHWWFEGPLFINFLLRQIGHDPSSPIRLSTCIDYLDRNPTQIVAEPALSSWGDGGYSAVWVDGSNDWIYRHVHHAEVRMRLL